MMKFVVAALLFVLLGAAYVKGYDVVRDKSPEHLPHFYLVMATVRMLLILTLLGAYVLLTDDRDETIRFALACLGMYVTMMVVTLALRH